MVTFLTGLSKCPYPAWHYFKFSGGMLTLWLLALMMALMMALPNQAIAAERLTASVDRRVIAENETFTLTVKYEDGGQKDSPDFRPLATNFDILANNQSSQYFNNNGRISSSTQWTLTLAPKQVGKTLIPPLSLGGILSQAITIEVNPAQDLPKESQVVFLETHVDTRDVYVQEEFLVTFKLFFRENLSEVSAADFVVPGTSIQELPKAQYQTTLVHTNYQVVELRFSVTPEASGTLSIPSFLWNIRTANSPTNRFGSNLGRATLHRLKTEPLTINVKARPAEFPASAIWLPAKLLTLSEKWSDTSPQFRVGEPVTRSITLNARGLSGEQLPPITANLVSDDFKFYPDQPDIKSDSNDQGKLGTRIESMAIVPTRAGQLTLPAIEVYWWDTRNDKLQVATLPAKTVTVAPALIKPEQSLSTVLPATELQSSGSSKSDSAQVVYKTDRGIWPWLSVGLALLNMAQLAVCLLILRRRQSESASADHDSGSHKTPRLFAAIISAAEQNNGFACHHALQAWLRQTTPIRHQSPRQYLASLGADQELLDELSALDQHLFKSDAGVWNGKKLAVALAAWQKQPKQSHQDELAHLYPA